MHHIIIQKYLSKKKLSMKQKLKKLPNQTLNLLKKFPLSLVIKFLLLIFTKSSQGSGDFLSKMSELSLKGDLSRLFKDYEQFFEVLEKPGENGKSMNDLKEMSDHIERKSDVFVQKVEALCKNEKLQLEQRNILTA